MAINFFSPKDNDEERAMHSNSERIEIIIYDKADGNIEKNFSTFQLFNFFLDIKFGWKHQRKEVVLSLTVFIYCIKNIIK